MPRVDLKEAEKDFGRYLEYLEEHKLLVRIEEEVNTEKDIGDYMYKSSVQNGPALFFENIRSDDLGIKYDIPLVGSLISSRKRASIGIGATEEDATAKCVTAQQRPIAPQVLDKDPFDRKVITGDEIDILRLLPVAKCSPKDGGKYIGTGVITSRDPEYGRNLAISRHHVLHKNRLGILARPPQHTGIFQKRAAEKGHPLEVSIALGCAPDIIIASQFKPPIGVDETGLAGGLRGEPVKLVRGKTVDVEYPASAQIVIEGEIPPDVTEPEGPYGEYTGYYGERFEEQIVIDVKSIMIRMDIQPVFYGSCAMPVENDILRELPIEATTLLSLRRSCPGARSVRYPWYGGCADLAIIQLRKTFEDEGKVAMLNAFTSGARPKLVMVVDEDVDIFSDVEVLNALTYRMQAGKDVTIVRGPGKELDPSFISKASDGAFLMGIDATKPLGEKYLERIEDHSTGKRIPGLGE